MVVVVVVVVVVVQVAKVARHEVLVGDSRIVIHPWIPLKT